MHNQTFDFFVAIFNSDPHVITIEEFEGVDSPYLLKEGSPLKDAFPKNAIFQVSEDSGDVTTDFIDNLDSIVIISDKVKDFFDKSGLDIKKVEYLPFKLKNKRGRIDKDHQYYIANSLVKINCLDLKKSDFYWNPKKTKVQGVHVIELDKAKIPDDAIFFRLGEEPSRILLRSDFVDNLKAEKFTGLALCPTGQRLP